MARGFDSIPDKNQRDNVREGDLFEILQLNKKAKDTWVSLRFIPGDLLPIKKHWIKIMGGKDKDKELKIPRLCVKFNPDDHKLPLRGMKCPYCALEHGNDESGAPAQYDFKWYAQAIVRDDQSTQPRKLPKHTKKEKETGKKEKTSESWTPISVIPLTNSMAGMIRQMGERNFAQVKDKKSGQKVKTQFPITDAKYGLDVDIKYVPANPPANRYVMEKGERTPLTEEERAYLSWDFDDWEGIYDALGRLNEADAMTDFKKMDVIGTNKESDDEDDEDDGMSLGKKKKSKGKDKSSGKKKRRDLDDDEDDEDDEDEDDRRSSKKKKPTKSKRLLDDEDDDEDDEDDRRSKKKKSSSKSSKSAKSSKTSVKKKKKSLLDDDEDEDEPVKKKKKASSSSKSDKSSVKKKKKSSDDGDSVKKKKKKK